MSDSKDTPYSPAEMLTSKEPPERDGGLQGDTVLSRTLNRLQGMIAVVDGDRRIVYANQAFLDYLDVEDKEALCGLRPGDVFGCIHADETGEGCGGSGSCRFCGAVQAIRETQTTGAPATRECLVTGVKDGKTATHELLVRAMPFELASEHYVLISFRDISDRKRRNALERIFFHDILNTASGIRVYLDLLKTGMTDDGKLKLVEKLESISATLIEEIQSQKILVSAENKTLKVQKSLIVSTEFVRQIIQQFEDQDISRGKRIVIAPFSEAFSFVSDDSLLRRVLANMLKNALEASPQAATVTVGFAKQAGPEARFWVHNPTSMGEDIQHQIFKRYFSTKGEDRGLGTYSMKLLAEEYLGGRLSFESTREQGTTFTLVLPLKP